MKLMMPMWDASLLHRYEPEIRAMSKHLDALHVVYFRGNPQGGYADFHRIRLNILPGPRAFTYAASLGPAWQQVKDIQVDLYYCLSGFWFEQYMAYFARKAGKPYVVRLRGDDVKVREIYGRPCAQRWVMKQLYIRTLRGANLVIPISEAMRSLAFSHGVNPRRVTAPLPNGVDTKLFKPSPWKFDSFRLGYAGRISPEKGIDFLTRLMQETPDVDYVVAGKDQIGWTPPGNAEYWGELDYKEMPRFYKAITALLIPSYTEGYSCVLREAYACGRPVIISSAALTPEARVFGLCLPHDLEDWKKVIYWLKEDYMGLRSSSTIVEWGAKATEWAGRFSWEEYGKALVRLLEKTQKWGGAWNDRAVRRFKM